MRGEQTSGAYLEYRQSTNRKLFQKNIDFKPFATLAESSILDVWLSSQYASVLSVREVKAFCAKRNEKKF